MGDLFPADDFVSWPLTKKINILNFLWFHFNGERQHIKQNPTKTKLQIKYKSYTFHIIEFKIFDPQAKQDWVLGGENLDKSRCCILGHLVCTYFRRDFGPLFVTKIL